MRTPDSIEHVKIVGSGLVGSMLAMYLARRGYDVEVFERRPDMRKETIRAGRSINLALSTRGIHALERLGLAEAVLAEAIPMKGRVMHATDGVLSYQPYGKNDDECIYSISRGGLNKTLLANAEATGRVRIHFRHRATAVDFDAATLECVDEASGEPKRVAGDLLFGTDGSASALRAAMKARPGFVQSEDVLSYGYKEFHIPPTADGGFQLEKNALHIWPRGTFMLIALPNFDGSFTCTLFLPWEGALSFEALQEASAVERFFATYFADVVPLLTDVTGTFFTNPTGQMITVKCAPWNVGARALVLGDAAHAIVPFFGQGMNCGFEDCALLDDFITANPSGWHRDLATFAASRKPDADAIADMAVANFVEMRDKVGDPGFLLEKAIEKRLLNAFPGRFTSRYALVSFSRVPYRFAQEVGFVADGILQELRRGVASADEVDLAAASSLIAQKLEPVLKR
jgi:kynurenine 3-monooxygenase